MRIITQSGMPTMFHQFISLPIGAAENLHAESKINSVFASTPKARIAMPRLQHVLLQQSQSSTNTDQDPTENRVNLFVDTQPRARAETLFQRLQKLGSIGIVNGGGAGPTPNAMDLLSLGFGHSVAIACEESPPNLLNDFPNAVTNVVSTTQVGALAKVDTMFMLECTTAKAIQNAKYMQPTGRVVVVGAELHQVAEQVALLHRLRPDVALFGHAASEFALYAPSQSANPVQAAQAVAAMLGGDAATVVRPLLANDSAWMSERTGCAIAAGTAIPAPFFNDGTLDRTKCSALLASPETGLHDTIEQLVALQHESSATLKAALLVAQKECDGLHAIRRASRVPGNGQSLIGVDRRIKLLGPTVVYGANGNIGSSLLKSLAGSDIPLCGIMRKPDRSFLRGFDCPAMDVVVSDKVAQDFAPQTAFITASTGWPKDAAGNIIFDRSLLLTANIAILAPIFKSLPASIPLVMVISNPCSEMAYLGWLVRPDLSRNLFAHAGTDVTRQMNRVKHPDDLCSFGTVGPHSPMQVNWEIKTPLVRHLPAQHGESATTAPGRRVGRIDPRIPLLGQLHQSRSRDKNSVTVPTAAAGIFEAINIATHVPQSYARPLTLGEANRLSEVLAQHGQKMTISEGLTPTMPRDAHGDIHWEMLAEAIDIVPEFPQKLGAALQAMEEGRLALLNALANKINRGRADDEKIDSNWILAHRGPSLADAIHVAKK